MITTYENQDVVQAASQEGLDILIKAIEKAGLLETLKSAESITIFAPDDDAFNKLEKGLLEGLMQVSSKERLADILKYHVISTAMPSDAVERLDNVEMLNGKNVEIFRKNGALMVNDAEIIEPDIKVKNGIIHKIDKVLVP